MKKYEELINIKYNLVPCGARGIIEGESKREVFINWEIDDLQLITIIDIETFHSLLQSKSIKYSQDIKDEKETTIKDYPSFGLGEIVSNDTFYGIIFHSEYEDTFGNWTYYIKTLGALEETADEKPITFIDYEENIKKIEKTIIIRNKGTYLKVMK